MDTIFVPSFRLGHNFCPDCLSKYRVASSIAALEDLAVGAPSLRAELPRLVAEIIAAIRNRPQT